MFSTTWRSSLYTLLWLKKPFQILSCRPSGSGGLISLLAHPGMVGCDSCNHRTRSEHSLTAFIYTYSIRSAPNMETPMYLHYLGRSNIELCPWISQNELHKVVVPSLHIPYFCVHILWYMSLSTCQVKDIPPPHLKSFGSIGLWSEQGIDHIFELKDGQVS